MEMLHELVGLTLPFLFYGPYQSPIANLNCARLRTVQVDKGDIRSADDTRLGHDQPESSSPSSNYS